MEGQKALKININGVEKIYIPIEQAVFIAVLSIIIYEIGRKTDILDKIFTF